MSAIECKELLLEISRKLDDKKVLGRLRRMLTGRLASGSKDIIDCIEDEQSLFNKLEQHILEADRLVEMKKLLEGVGEWSLLEKVKKFESKRKEYHDLLEQIILALDELNELERLITTCRRKISEELLSEESESHIQDVQDVRSLFKELENQNKLGIYKLDILKAMLTETEQNERLNEVKDFEERRKQEEGTYADRGPRISKDNLFMVLALRMEQFPGDDDNQETDSYRKVGAVLVLPNDMLYAVDCSRDGVHGIARLLTKHYDVTKDCKIFVSRKPCSFCTKLLVQCKIKKVFYLPIEPEYKDVEDFKEETSRVDDLFKTSSIGQSVFVPTTGGDVLAHSEKKYSTAEKARKTRKTELMNSYWTNGDWINSVKDDLPWPAFDVNVQSQVHKEFDITMEWMAPFLIKEKDGYTFNRKEADQTSTLVSFDPSVQKKRALFLISMAKILAQRSDDPNTGVGAVITNTALEIVALGWNGFPTKALYGEFPRASHDDPPELKKYPFTIHAEQNALLLRNTKNLANGILFVTKTPCDECTPLLAMEGIKTVVLGERMKEKPPSKGTLGYLKFAEQVRKGTFTCFEMHIMEPAESMVGPRRKKLKYDLPKNT